MKKTMAVCGTLFAVFAALVLYSGTVGDTEEDIFPDPTRGTVFRLSQLEVAARRQWDREGRPPPSMDALVKAVPEASHYTVDRWANPIALSVQGVFLVAVSAGRDSVRGTGDDIVQVSTRDSTWLGLGSVEEALRNPVDPPPPRDTVPR